MRERQQRMKMAEAELCAAKSAARTRQAVPDRTWVEEQLGASLPGLLQGQRWSRLLTTSARMARQIREIERGKTTVEDGQRRRARRTGSYARSTCQSRRFRRSAKCKVRSFGKLFVVCLSHTKTFGESFASEWKKIRNSKP